MFRRYDYDGTPIRNTGTGIDFTDCEVITEQSHRDVQEINSIVKRHGAARLAQIAQLQEYRFDDCTTNDFTEAMNLVKRAESAFMQLPSKLRARFENRPESFLDYIRNPENATEMAELGLIINLRDKAQDSASTAQTTAPTAEPTA